MTICRRRMMYENTITASTDPNDILKLKANTPGNHDSIWYDSGYYSSNAIQPNAANQPMLIADVFGAGNYGYLFNASQADSMSVLDNDQLTFNDGTADLAFTFEVDAIFNAITSSKTLIFKGSSTVFEYFFGLIHGVLWIYCYQTASIYIRAGKAFTPILGTAYNLKITYTGSKSPNGFQMYINGVQQNSMTRQTAGIYTGMVNTTTALKIGYGSISTQVFDGYLGSVKITRGVV